MSYHRNVHPSHARAYQCPGCGERVHAADPGRVKLGPWYKHARCHPTCRLCGEEIQPPPIGKGYTVVPYLGAPVHLSCKENV